MAMAAAGCDGTDPTQDPDGTVCGNSFDVEAGVVGEFGAEAAAQKVEAFLQATIDVHQASLAIEGDVRAACAGMAADLEIPAGELAPAAGELAVTATCRRVAEEIEGIVAASLPVGLALGVTVTPAVCEVDLDLAAQCAGTCDVTVEGDAEVACAGELYGQCSGACAGSCQVEGSAACEGSCSAMCTGTCAGTCRGQCNGTCSLTDAQGNCIGTCSAACSGVCEGTCTGMCAGTCTVDVQGACEGECHGTCDVGWEARCDGAVDVMADADCQAACETRAYARATCTEPEIAIFAAISAEPAAQARLDALIATLAANYPLLLRAQAQAQNALVPSIEQFTSSLESVAGAAVDVGIRAAACTAVAVDAAIAAAAVVQASVSVSVSVQVSVAAEGEVSAGG